MPDLTRAAMRTRHDDKAEKARKVKADRVTAYRLVDIRDGYKCRCCFRFVSAANADPARRSEHHHINGRVGKHAESTENICLLCRACHDLRHVKRTLVIVGNANQPLTFELGGKVWHG